MDKSYSILYPNENIRSKFRSGIEHETDEGSMRL